MKWNPGDKNIPKDGREVIVWTSSKKGFQDATTTINWYEAENQWLWCNTDYIFSGPIHGWMDYPQPHARHRPDGSVAIYGGDI